MNTFEQAFELNKQQTRSRLNQLKKQQKRENTKNTILAILIGTFIVTITLMHLSATNKENIKKCMDATGYSASTCTRKLS